MDRFEPRSLPCRSLPADDHVTVDERYFTPTAALKAALAKAPEIDYGQFRADLDAFADQDPTPRFWPEG